MINLDLIKSLSIKNDKKIVFVIIDGLGGAVDPSVGRTELDVANHPNLDNLAKESLCGLAIPVDYGITPGSGPGHLALFGYDPIKYMIGRGILEVLGLGMELGPNDLAFRGNFATISNDDIVIDRRAGRIPTEETIRLIKKIQNSIKKIDDVEIILKAGKEHRFAGVFRHSKLVEDITENDPHKEGNKPHEILPTINTEEALFTASVVNKFILQVKELLKDEPKANYVLLRGFAKYPNIPKMQEVYKLTPVAIAVYPMYKGIAKVVGMEVVDGCETIEDEFNKLQEFFFKPYDFYYLHIKDTDKLGEDGNFEGKVKKIEEIDKFIPKVLSLQPDVLVITGDHSTPAITKGHSWHPVPILIWSKNIPACVKNNVNRFTEEEFSRGMLGHIYMTKIILLAMAYSSKLDKYGA